MLTAYMYENLDSISIYRTLQCVHSICEKLCTMYVYMCAFAFVVCLCGVATNTKNLIYVVAICKIHDVHKYLGIKSLIAFQSLFSLSLSLFFFALSFYLVLKVESIFNQPTFYGKSSLDTFHTLIANEFR